MAKKGTPSPYSLDEQGRARRGSKPDHHQVDEAAFFHLLGVIVKEVRCMAASIADLQAQVAALTSSVEQESTLDDSIIALLDGQAAILAQVQQQLADLIAQGGGDTTALQGVSDALGSVIAATEANKAKISAAIVKNTPEGA